MNHDIFAKYHIPKEPIYVGIDVSGAPFYRWTDDERSAMVSHLADALTACAAPSVTVLQFAHDVIDVREFFRDQLDDLRNLTLLNGAGCDVDKLGNTVQRLHRARYGVFSTARLFIITPDGHAARRVPHTEGIFTVYLVEGERPPSRAPFVEVYQKAA